MIKRLVPLPAILFLVAAACAAQVGIYAGETCLLYRDGSLVQSWPGGYPPHADELAVGEADHLYLRTVGELTEERLDGLLVLLESHGEVIVGESGIEIEALAEPPEDFTSFAWVTRAGDDVPVAHLLQAAAFLRAKLSGVRESWRAFVADKVLAITGWGALEVDFVDGAPSEARYQPWGSPAHELLLERGVIDGEGLAAEYADHPEVNGVAEWLIIEGLSPLYAGDFSIIVGCRWE